MQFEPKDGSDNPYWQEFFLYNSAEPIAAVYLNGKALQLDG